MKRTTLSLRARLLILTLIPLSVISVLSGYWRVSTATQTTRELFDRNLIALTLAVSRDIIVSGGDALADTTAEMLDQSFGGKLYYHVHGPDGTFVTGYSSPPPMPREITMTNDIPILFDSTYRGERVRVARLREYSSYGFVSGYSAVTVWQPMAARDDFLRDLAIKAMTVIASLFVTVAVVVWFGINLGLKPLTDLQDAISKRTTSDLNEIKRPVPREVAGIVATLNTLFGKLSAAMSSRDRFISDAAHQLRNPIAGLYSLAQAAREAKTPGDQHARIVELSEAARQTARLSNQLLSLERATSSADASWSERIEVNEVVREVCERNADRILAQDIDFSLQSCDDRVEVMADRVLLQESIQNLLDNALTHAGPHNTQISVSVTVREGYAVITVADTGIGLSVGDSEVAFARFGQVRPGEGSGLGLSIVAEVAHRHGGEAVVEPSEKGARISISLPLAAARAE